MATIEEHEYTFEDGKKKTFYLAAGPREGPLLIFVHGWPAIAKVWERQLRVFAALGFRAVAPDMPGMFSAFRQPTVYQVERCETEFYQQAMADLQRVKT